MSKYRVNKCGVNEVKGDKTILRSLTSELSQASSEAKGSLVAAVGVPPLEPAAASFSLLLLLFLDFFLRRSDLSSEKSGDSFFFFDGLVGSGSGLGSSFVQSNSSPPDLPFDFSLSSPSPKELHVFLFVSRH